MNDAEKTFLEALQAAGGRREVQGDALSTALRLHDQKLAHLTSGPWPVMVVLITAAGRRALARLS
jgi:hypothetical protein